MAFEGFDTPLGSAGVKFIRSIPLDKALASTLLAYEMNGEPLPLKHGYPLRALALGWTGANCVKWLSRIAIRDRPWEGFFMDNVYRVSRKGQDPRTGEVVTGLKLKSIITQPLPGETLPAGTVVMLGAAYAGESTWSGWRFPPTAGNLEARRVHRAGRALRLAAVAVRLGGTGEGRTRSWPAQPMPAAAAADTGRVQRPRLRQQRRPGTRGAGNDHIKGADSLPCKHILGYHNLLLFRRTAGMPYGKKSSILF